MLPREYRGDIVDRAFHKDTLVLAPVLSTLEKMARLG